VRKREGKKEKGGVKGNVCHDVKKEKLNKTKKRNKSKRTKLVVRSKNESKIYRM